jgi:phage terminase small subunit
MPSKRLDPRDWRFIDAYLTDPEGSATAAAIKAGHSPRSARQRAFELLQRKDVQEAIARRRKKALDAADATAEWIAGEMFLHASYDPIDVACVPALDEEGRTILGDDGNPIMVDVKSPADIARLPEHIRRVIKGWGWDQKGNFTLKLVDRQTALEQLARWRQMYVTKTEHTGPGGGPIQTEDLSGLKPEERSARIAELLAKRDAADGAGGG